MRLPNVKRLALILTILLAGLVATPLYAAQRVVSITGTNNPLQSESGTVWTNSQIGYAFYVIANNAGLYYTKTTNGGETWAAGVKIQTSADTSSRISNFNIWYGLWTAASAGNKIHLTWNDAILDQVHYVNLDPTTDTLGTEVNASSVTAFTLDTSHSSQGVTITVARNGYIYIAARTSTSLSGGNRFLRSIDAGANWTTRTISHTPASVQTIKGYLLPGNETDSADIYGWNVPQLSSTAEVWTYDDSANTWSISHTVTLVNPTTSSGLCQCAIAHNSANGHSWVGVRDNAGTASATFYLAEITNSTSIVNRTNVYTSQSNRGEGITLYYDRNASQLLATSIIQIASENNPAYRISLDNGVTYTDVEQYVDTSDSMTTPHTAPGASVYGSRWQPLFSSTDSGNTTIETESTLDIDFSAATPDDDIIMDDELGDKIERMLDGGRFGGESGKNLFGIVTLILLAIFCYFVKAPTFIAMPLLAMWAGGLALTGFFPPWTILVAILIGGLGYLAREAFSSGGDD